MGLLSEEELLKSEEDCLKLDEGFKLHLVA